MADGSNAVLRLIWKKEKIEIKTTTLFKCSGSIQGDEIEWETHE